MLPAGILLAEDTNSKFLKYPYEELGLQECWKTCRSGQIAYN